MSKKNYSSGNPDSKSDFYVEFISANSDKIKISIQSKNEVLHRSKLEHTSQMVISDLGIKPLRLIELLQYPITPILDMTKEEVRIIYGEPNSSKEDVMKTKTVETWTYLGKSKKIDRQVKAME